ncbi:MULTISPECIES: terminase small subunit-like protein [Rhizobium]|uniref:terminase small subunit-like protein n=1 Tax=Rhizobium TaxID=379 RepID=UPI0018D99E33|nr:MULTISPECIES: terminase small subunit protein [Rhizobium]MDG3578395.1 terminase small subunit protein [Rhizobium sp. YJ-22]
MGRPSAYSGDIAAIICERIADGNSLRTICAEDGMPNKATVLRWISSNDAFRDQYARAREAQADALFDEILAIADAPLIGEKIKIDKDGNKEITRGDMIEHRRLQVDTRKWMASKLLSKKYGDKQQLEHSGVDGAPLVPIINLSLSGAKPTT